MTELSKSYLIRLLNGAETLRTLTVIALGDDEVQAELAARGIYRDELEVLESALYRIAYVTFEKPQPV